jgi:hypothetical protein
MRDFGRIVSGHELEKLKEGGVPDPDLARQTGGLDCLRLPDGRVLFPMGSTGRLYEKSELQALLAKIPRLRAQAAKHHLHGRELSADFPTAVPSLVAEAPARFGAGEAPLPLTIDGLKELDRRCREIGRRKCLEASRFSVLVAVFGESLRALKEEGDWEMRIGRDGDAQIYEPWISNSKNWQVNVGWAVYRGLREYGLELEARLAMIEVTDGSEPTAGFWTPDGRKR